MGVYIMAKGFMGSLVSGLAGNLSEMNKDSVKAEYGKYLLQNEEVAQAFTLIRDVVIFTDIRMIIIDKQGATGRKMSVKSVFLMNIVDCSMETAGMGVDDSEINITFLTNIKRTAHNESVATHKLEFPKKMDIAPLYTWLLGLAYKNRLEINSAE
jgi:hypothetical protein